MTDLSLRHATAIAHPNIALIKYWGKTTDTQTNEPAVSSLSITLDTLNTETTLQFDAALAEDTLTLNGVADTTKLPRISRALDTLRTLAGSDCRCHIITKNNFPTGAGLASSASGFAALVVAANEALNLNLSKLQQSKLARGMSGSAARSIFGGYAKIYLPHATPEQAPFGAAFAEPVAAADHWPLEICVAIASEKEKVIGSTEGMESSRLSSPYYQAWLDGNDADVRSAEQWLHDKDFQKLADLSEFSCLKMHAMALASQPGLLYWNGATMNAMHCVREMRATGIPVFFTVDAGPQVKAICAPGHSAVVAEALEQVPGIQRVLRCGLGPAAHVIKASNQA